MIINWPSPIDFGLSSNLLLDSWGTSWCRGSSKQGVSAVAEYNHDCRTMLDQPMPPTIVHCSVAYCDAYWNVS